MIGGDQRWGTDNAVSVRAKAFGRVTISLVVWGCVLAGTRLQAAEGSSGVSGDSNKLSKAPAQVSTSAPTSHFLTNIFTGDVQKVASTERPVLGRNANGYLEVFRVEADGTLQHRWQKPANGDWAGWSRLGAGFQPGIAVASDLAGRLVVFALSQPDGELMLARQVSTNSTEWTAWSKIGSACRGPLAAGRNADGRLEVFARDLSDGSVVHLWQEPKGWSKWSKLGPALEPGFTAVTNIDGRLELFGVLPGSGELTHCWQQARNGKWSPWSRLGGSVLPGLAVGQNALGILEVFAVGVTNHAVQRIRQSSPGTSEQWSDWEDFGGDLKDGIATGNSADGRLEVMGVNRGNGQLMHRWEILNNGSDLWSEWASLGAAALPYPAVGQNEDGNLEVFAMDVKDPATLNHRRQISRASDWLDWETMEHVTFRCSSRTWQTDEGLPHNQVQALAQTPEGFLWVGTRGGLARFDGVTFTTFNSGNTPELRSSSITSLCADHEGTLWVGTDGGGLVRLRDGVFTHFGKEDGLAGDTLRVIYESLDGTLWFGTTNGMSRYRGGKFTTYTRQQGLASDVVLDIHEDRDGFLWIATGEGLNRLKGEKMDTFAMPNGLPNDSVRVIWQDRAARIWIGSNNGMLWYNAFWRSFFAYNTKYGLSDTFVSAICDDREGNLWVGTYSGLNRFRDGRFFNELNNEGVPFDRVNALFEDREGDLWVGSREGLTRLTPERFRAITKRQGLSHNNVTSVLGDNDGTMWLGTWGGGLNRLEGETVRSYESTNELSQALVLGLAEGRDGTLWVGADFDGGLTRLKDGVFTHFTWKDGLPKAAVRVVHEDGSGTVWVGTGNGLCALRNGKFTGFTTREHLAGDSIRDLCEDRAGNLWVGTETGLSRRRNGKFESYDAKDGMTDPMVLALYADAETNLWIGTHEGGLLRFHDGHFTAYTTRQGLFSDEIFGITEEGGWLWMTCSKGIFRVRKADLDAVDAHKVESFASVVYGKSDGLESVQCSSMAKPAVWKAADGQLWFPTTKGVVMVDPRTLRTSHQPPPVFIQEVQADRRKLEPKPAKGWVERAEQTAAGLTASGLSFERPTEAVRVPPGRGELEFQFTAPSLSSPEETRFRYKLDNADVDWVDAGTRRTAHYNNIYPGNYTFRVLACSRDGIWSTEAASVAVLVKPHVYQTWWWRGALALVVVGGASGLARYVTRRRMQRAMQLLEQRHAIEKERGRIAKDIHDDLGSSLTRIMMLGERAEEGLARNEEVGTHVRKIVSSARSTVQAMDEIVWAVNPNNDTLEGLVEYLTHYADEFFENTEVSCRLEIPVELPACVLPAEFRHDLFLIVKEAFHNVLKHSKATKMRVCVAATSTTLEIQLEDNGEGFEPGAARNGRRGNGLQNMRRRIEAHGGSLTIESANGKGTRIKAEVPLPRSANGVV